MLKKLFSISGFAAYLAVMFLNATVDNAHKITLSNILTKSYADGDKTLFILQAIISMMILLPFVLLFSPAGFISDKYSKTKVIRACALAGLIISILIAVCYFLGLFAVAFLMTFILAVQSAIYSPAKYGIIKSIVGTENLGAANGVIQALTLIAILFAMFIFSFIFEARFASYLGENNPSEILKFYYFIGISLVVLSICEFIFAMRLPMLEKGDESAKFSYQQYFRLQYLFDNLKIIYRQKNIWLAIVGLSIFWGISQIIIATFSTHYKAVFQDSDTAKINGILALSLIGIAFGSSIAGKLSKRHIEVGIVPLGALGMYISLYSFGMSSKVLSVAISSFAFGLFGGMFIVPLNSIIQYFAPERKMGKVIAGNNFMQNLAMILFLLTGILLVNLLGFSTTQLFAFVALIACIGSFYSILQLPHLFARILLLPILKKSYKFEVEGVENLPQSGGVLLLGNHISWIDWLVLQVASPRAIKFVMYKEYYNRWYLTWLLKFFKVIPISERSSKESFKAIKERLDNGEVVALFPEGIITYNGQINEFQKGFEFVLENWENPVVVPFYLRGLWGSSFSRADDYYKQLTSKQVNKRELIVAFGKPINGFIDRSAMRQKVIELSFISWEQYISRQKALPYQWLHISKQHLLKTSIVDNLAGSMNNLKVLTGVLFFIKIIRKNFASEKNIGVLLPSSAVASIVNMALLATGKVPVNLNYTLSAESMQAALRKANINSVITSNKFLEKLKRKGFDFESVLGNKIRAAEDLTQTVNKNAKTVAFLSALLLSENLIKQLYFAKIKTDETAAILFSSGSEGEPKGVELSHKNILANIKQVSGLINFRRDDVVLNSLPIFHSFGLTVTTFMPLCEGVKMVCVADPTDAQSVGKMAARYSATIIFGTSTFFRLYVKSPKLLPLMFQSARIIVAGAEKLKTEVKEAFKLKFGMDICEGYGATETAPVAAVNTPNMLERDTLKELIFSKAGTVGMPLPGTVIKIVNPEDLTELKNGEDGLILIGGSQVMKGYLNDPKKTEEVIVEIDGVRYYKTGDKGHIDEQGFVSITDRYSRFAKIGGEMISLGSVEEKLTAILGDVSFSVVAVPDEKKGEAVVLLIKTDEEIASIKEKVKQSDLLPLMQPTHYFAVENLPVLASGKADFKGAKQLALEFLAK
ncbi:MAG: acyl-[Cardiobacteriaceae bacterium]|nr:acyl-[ACP]--phospholipid O-acyltransferase [Cardiobacteriaceae bacterium]